MRTTSQSKRRSTLCRAISEPFRHVWYACRNPRGGYLGGHPELELFPTDEQRRLALRRTASKIIGKRPFFIAASAAAGISLVTTLALRKFVANLGLPISQTMINLMLMLPVMIPCALFGAWLLSRHVPKLLRYELLDCGVPICVPCGYALIGASGPNCPECGRPFDERCSGFLASTAPHAKPMRLTQPRLSPKNLNPSRTNNTANTTNAMPSSHLSPVGG